MKKVVFLTALLLGFIFEANSQETDKKFGFEFSAGVSFPTAELAGTDLNTGFGFEGIFHYRFMPHLGLYAGWGLNQFTADNSSFAGNDVCFEETGYILGLEYKKPIANTSIQYYLRGGALYAHVETENEDGDIIDNTGHGWGWQAAAGVDIPLGSNWSLTPGLKYNSLVKDNDFDGVDMEFEHQYLSVRIGVLKRF